MASYPPTTAGLRTKSQAFTSSGTWPVPATVSSARVRAKGGGGSTGGIPGGNSTTGATNGASGGTSSAGAVSAAGGTGTLAIGTGAATVLASGAAVSPPANSGLGARGPWQNSAALGHLRVQDAFEGAEAYGTISVTPGGTLSVTVGAGASAGAGNGSQGTSGAAGADGFVILEWEE